jgi:hypothetical protein
LGFAPGAGSAPFLGPIGPKAAPRAKPDFKQSQLRRGEAAVSHPAAKPIRSITQSLVAQCLSVIFSIEQATRVNKFFPRGLDHALIFFTAGEAVRRVVPEHVPYAEKFGIWNRGLGPLKPALDEIWKPYLDGHGTRDEAFAALIERMAIKPSKKQTSN